MKLFKTDLGKKLVVLVIFILGMVLRLWKYPFYPFPGHAEEYLFVWSGLSLIEKGVPISWNDLPVYEEKHVYWRGVAPNPADPTGGGIGVRLLKPWLDEPPLFSLIVGGIAKLYNLENFTVISPYVIRIPSLIFGGLSLVMVFIIANGLFGYKTGVLASLIYAVTPVVVFGSRLAVPENMITFLALVCLWLIYQYTHGGKKWQRNLAIFLAGLAGLAKPTGYLLVPFVSFFVLKQKKWREGIRMLLAGSLIFWVPFLLYGAHYDWLLFLKVLFFQSKRPAGWIGLSTILTNPGFSIEIFLDSFIVLGFLSLIFLVFKEDKSENEEILLFVFLYFILTVIISGGKHDQLTWYRYPIYPFLAMSLAIMLIRAIKSSSFFTNALMVPILLANVDLLENPFWKYNRLIQSGPFRIVLFILLLPSILSLLFKNKIFKKINSLILSFCLILGIFINILVIKNWFNQHCDNTLCSLPQKIDLLQFLRKRK